MYSIYTMGGKSLNYNSLLVFDIQRFSDEYDIKQQSYQFYIETVQIQDTKEIGTINIENIDINNMISISMEYEDTTKQILAENNAGLSDLFILSKRYDSLIYVILYPFQGMGTNADTIALGYKDSGGLHPLPNLIKLNPQYGAKYLNIVIEYKQKKPAKLISLDRMKDFLSGCKSIFFDSTCHPTSSEIEELVTDGFTKQVVNFYTFVSKQLPNSYSTITELPNNIIEYLQDPVGYIASDVRYMFANCNNLLEIPYCNIDTSQCTSFYYFAGSNNGYGKISKADLTWLNCNKGTDFGAFLRGTDLEKVDDLDYSNINNAYCMFADMNYVKQIDIASMKNSNNLQNMDQMFVNDKLLEKIIGIENINTANVTKMSYCFKECSKLTNMDLSNWDTNKNTRFVAMFSMCVNLKNVNIVLDMASISQTDINDFATSSTANRYPIFYQAPIQSGVKIKNPPQMYYDDIEFFNTNYLGLTSDQYEIVS